MLFKIHAKRITGEKRVFYYDNELSTLRAEDGFEFYRTGAIEQRPDAAVFSQTQPGKKSREIRILKIQMGLSCNYACDYCSQRFVERPPQSSKKDIDAFMTKLEALSFSEKSGLKIEIWGGEPLVYWKTVKPLVEALQERFSSWKTKPQFSMITNGSLLTPEINYWLMVNDFAIAISHDGPGQSVRGPDPFDDPKAKKSILELYRQLSKSNRISFNSMLTVGNPSRKAIFEWFKERTGEANVIMGEGSLVDAYDEGGSANQLATKAQHFAFRKQAFNDIFGTDGQIGFSNILQKIDNFTQSVLDRVPSSTIGQKCGMDAPDTIAVDLQGNVVTCQNVSAVQDAPNGQSHKLGTLEAFEQVALTTSTHWSERDHCRACPVLHLCRGSCMFLEGENWATSCANAFSDNIALFALSFEKITNGFIPTFIEGGDLPDDRRDIWGESLTHEEKPIRKVISLKVVNKKQDFDGVEVFTRSEVQEA